MTTPGQDDLESRISAIIATQLAAQKEVHDAQIEELRKELEAARRATETALSALPAAERVPQHAGGPGLEIAPTWSQAQQTESARDALPVEAAHSKLADRVSALEEMSSLRGETLSQHSQSLHALDQRVAAVEWRQPQTPS